MKLVKNQLYYEEILNGERVNDGSKEELQKLEALKISNNSILKEYNSRDFATSVYFSIRKKRRKYLQTVMSLCGLFLITVIGFNINKQEVRMKGDGSILTIYKKVNGENRVVEESDSFSQGDNLQITYFATDWKYGTIISLDGDGLATLHYPSSYNDDAYLIKDTEAVLPYSYELDDAKNFERFYFIVSNKKIDVKKVIKKIENGDLDKISDPQKVVDIVEVKKD